MSPVPDSTDDSELPSPRESSDPTAEEEIESPPIAQGTKDAYPSDSGSPSTEEPTPASTSVSESTTSLASPGSWQAVWSPAHNAYYFYNSVTQETTWVNPFQPNLGAEAGPSTANDASTSTDAAQNTAALSSAHDIYAAAAAQGIDPALAHLDPSLAASTPLGAFAHTAKFNARTGAFTRPDGRDPTHLSEYERAKRMSEFYFDVNAWEQDVEQRKLEEAQEEAEGRKRKRPTKKDLDRFKEKKKQKKLAKTAWLRT